MRRRVDKLKEGFFNGRLKKRKRKGTENHGRGTSEEKGRKRRRGTKSKGPEVREER